MIVEIFSKVAENDVFQANPANIHFSGFEIKKTSKQILVSNYDVGLLFITRFLEVVL